MGSLQQDRLPLRRIVWPLARRDWLALSEGADTVLWAADDRVVALGQCVVSVIEPGKGVVLTSRLN